MLVKKFVPCIYLYNGHAVRRLTDLSVVETDPLRLVNLYNENGADGLVVFDMSQEDREHEEALDIIKEICATAEMEVTGAGNIKRLEDVKLVMSGAGAAGTAIYKLLRELGLRRAVLCDIRGIVYPGRPDLKDDPALAELAELTGPEITGGGVAAAIKGADVFIGVSAPGIVTQEMVRSMASGPVLFPMANPTPEIMPDLAKEAGAAVVGTGRSDFPNQINNVLAFPGVFRGAFDVRASRINGEMKLAAVRALADLVGPDELSPDYIIPAAFDQRVCPAVAKAVAEAARRTGAARA